jgi:hypothetical protein
MATVTRSGSFQCCWNPCSAGGVKIRERIENPPGIVEVAGQHLTAITVLKGVQAGMDVTAEMPPNHAVGVGQILPIRAASIHPSATNSWSPSRLSRTLVFPPKSVHIIATGKEGSE